MTNADHIRRMTDEELAIFLADEIPNGDCYGCKLECTKYVGDPPNMGDCQSSFYRMLKQPYKENENG